MKNKLDINLINQILRIIYTFLLILLVYVLINAGRQFGVFKFVSDFIGVLSPLFSSLILAWLLDPIVDFFERKKIKRVPATIITIFIVLLFVVLMVSYMIPMLISQIGEAFNFFSEIGQESDKIFTNFANWIKVNNIPIDINEIQENYNLVTIAESFITSASSSIISVVSSTFSSLFNIILIFVITVYLLIDFDRLVEMITNLIPVKYRKDSIELAKRVDEGLTDTIRGILMIAAIISLVSSIGFWIIGLPSPLLFGLICGITNIIPYIGPYIGGIFAGVVALNISVQTLIFCIIIVAAVQQIEGMFLQPLVMGRTTSIHPVVIMMGLLVFGKFFGIVGMIVATPIINMIRIILLFFIQKYNWFSYKESEPAIEVVTDAE